MESSWYKACRVKVLRKVPESYGLPCYYAMQLLDLHGLDRVPTEDDLEIAHWLIGDAGVDLVDGIQGVFKDALDYPSSRGDRRFMGLMRDFVVRYKDMGEDKWQEYTHSPGEPLRKKVCEKLLAP